ncbi:hypothetical protein R3P38DRAFT_2767134 [Favolaschia claudopus]|uniref:Uncharacterized protein n=1 Tax=Favolaschia claudopus TaxID=2862362 RepID=A0AAW0CWL5_9AGAR
MTALPGIRLGRTREKVIAPTQRQSPGFPPYTAQGHLVLIATTSAFLALPCRPAPRPLCLLPSRLPRYNRPSPKDSRSWVYDAHPRSACVKHGRVRVEFPALDGLDPVLDMSRTSMRQTRGPIGQRENSAGRRVESPGICARDQYSYPDAVKTRSRSRLLRTRGRPAEFRDEDMGPALPEPLRSRNRAGRERVGRLMSGSRLGFGR